MNRNSIKDDELEKVNGGNQQELMDLADCLRQQTLDVGALEKFLNKHGIEAYLHDSQYRTNSYKNKETGERLTHEQVIELIKKNRWH